MKKYNPARRRLLNNLMLASGALSLPLPFAQLQAQQSFNGKLVIALQLEGGLDVTSFCDPKINIEGEDEINRWARKADPLKAGKVSYAPVASNQWFFEKYYRDMLVINGVDSQTNSHTTGVIHNWSGRNSLGYPTATALYAASKAPDFPMAYLNFGGFGAAENLVSVTRVSDPRVLSEFVAPNSAPSWDENNRNMMMSSRFQRIQEMHKQTAAEMVNDADSVGGNYRNRQAYLDALTKTDSINRFADFIPDSEFLQENRELSQNFWSSLHQQIQISLLAFKAEVAVAADLTQGGFDTHNNNDRDQAILLDNTVDGIDYLWMLAEELGLADRLVLIIGTDFGRTPHYNANDGKDHWPIGSTIVMEKNAAYTNRVFGKTDEGHNALKIDPKTGKGDDDGLLILPSHVHKAFRRYLDIDNNAMSKRFAFNNTEDLSLFSV